MGSPVIISDGSPVKITWWEEGWTVDEAGLTLSRQGTQHLSGVLFNVFKKINPRSSFRLRVGFRSKKQDATLLVTTNAGGTNLTMTIEQTSSGKKFANFFNTIQEGKHGVMRTPNDASITSIEYQVGSGKKQQVETLKLLPTTIVLLMDD